MLGFVPQPNLQNNVLFLFENTILLQIKSNCRGAMHCAPTKKRIKLVPFLEQYA